MAIIIDAGATYLAMCSCGWRGLPTSTRQTAWELGAGHEAACHTAADQARHALDSARRRDV